MDVTSQMLYEIRHQFALSIYRREKIICTTRETSRGCEFGPEVENTSGTLLEEIINAFIRRKRKWFRVILRRQSLVVEIFSQGIGKKGEIVNFFGSFASHNYLRLEVKIH